MNPLYQDELFSTTARNPAASGAATVGVNGPPVQRRDVRKQTIAGMSGFDKVGSGLQEVGAALQGKPSPLDARIQQQQQDRLLQLQEFKVHTDALEDGVKMASKLKGPARKQFISNYAAQLDEVRPGLGKTYESLSDTPDLGAVLAKYSDKSPTLARAIELDPTGEAALKLLSSPEAIKTINAEIDSSVMPTLHKKGQTFMMGWQQIVPKEMAEKINQDGRVTASELLQANQWVKENRPELKALVLSDEDLQIINRNEDAFYGSLGIVTPKKEQEVMADRIKEEGKGNKIEWIGQPGGKKQQAAIDKDGNIVKLIGSPIDAHAAPVNVYTGSLTPGVDEEGKPIFVQPSGRADVPPRKVEGVYPPEKADQRKAAQKADQDRATYDSVDKQITDLEKLVKENEGKFTGTTGAKGLAGRAAETTAGIFDPKGKTPALDVKNKKELLIATLRKSMADSNMSKADRDALEFAIGGFDSLWSTQGSTLNALANLRQFVKEKFKIVDVKGTGEEPKEVSEGLVEENGKWLEYKNGRKIYTWPSKESYDNYQKAIGKKK